MALELALLPIPGAFCFPTNVVPFHIFEPRYRQMVQDCIRDGRMMAVCDVMGALTEPKAAPRSQEEALNSNLQTYVPQEVYGGGTIDIREKLPDGRLMIDLKIKNRFRTLKIKQQIPYLIAEVEVLEDIADSIDLVSDTALINNLVNHLAHIFSIPPEQVRKQIHHNVGGELDLAKVTFQILGIIRTQPQLMQEFMLQQSPRERAMQLAELLAPPQATSH